MKHRMVVFLVGMGMTIVSSQWLMVTPALANEKSCKTTLAGKLRGKVRDLGVADKARRAAEVLSVEAGTLIEKAKTVGGKAADVVEAVADRIEGEIIEVKPMIASTIERGREVLADRLDKESLPIGTDRENRETLATAINRDGPESTSVRREEPREPLSAVTPLKTSKKKESVVLSPEDYELEVTRLRNKQIKKEAPKIRETLQNLPSNTRFSQQLKGRFQGEYIKAILENYDGYALLLGHEHSPLDPKVKQQIEVLIAKLVRSHQPFIYDADSSWASMIADKAGPWGLGISGASEKASDKVVYLPNEFVRTMVFLHAYRIIHTPDSITGVAAFIMGSDFTKPERDNFLTLDVHGEWNQGLAEFGIGLRPDKKEREKLAGQLMDLEFPPSDYSLPALTDQRPENAGVKYGVETQSTVFAESDKLVVRYNFYGFESWGTFDSQWRIFADEEVYSFYQSTKQGVDILNKMDRVEDDSQKVKKGGYRAVVFGSAGKTAYDSKSARIIATLGLQSRSVTQGGAGGVMYLTGKIMKAIGTYTMGIPIVGKNSLKAENKIPREVHDITLEADGYESRIQALLYQRDLIEFAPGGKGTMRELAATLVRETVLENSNNKIVFFPREYYRGLYDYLQSLPLPTQLKKRILLVDSEEEAKSLLP